MALFKISRGGYAALPSNKTDGWAYFTPGNKGFYIDVVGNDVDGNNYNHRIKINERVDTMDYTLNASSWTSNVYLLEINLDDDAMDGNSYLFEIEPSLTGGVDEQFIITSALAKANISYELNGENQLVLVANGTQPTVNIPITVKRIPSEVPYISLL